MDYEEEYQQPADNFSSDYGGFVSFDDDTCLFQSSDSSPFV